VILRALLCSIAFASPYKDSALLRLRQTSDEKAIMVTIIHILQRLIGSFLPSWLEVRCRRKMWPFRWPSQDQEAPAQCSTSQAAPMDVKSVRAAMEKLRGYHDLAKARTLPHSSPPPDSSSHY
jgi:hypothetical protein